MFLSHDHPRGVALLIRGRLSPGRWFPALRCTASRCAVFGTRDHHSVTTIADAAGAEDGADSVDAPRGMQVEIELGAGAAEAAHK